jgi:hypothetical protein
MNGNLTEFSDEVKAQFFERFPSLLNLEHKIIENENRGYLPRPFFRAGIQHIEYRCAEAHDPQKGSPPVKSTVA